MKLIVGLCLLCTLVAPLYSRSVDTHEPPSEDLEPFVAHHHHEGNLAELLIPLLERSLAQNEERSGETHHKHKPAKKVIQVLPYRGSNEYSRKGKGKKKSSKKQVVKITPLHGKNLAKPLAYILSAIKPIHDKDKVNSETNDDVVNADTLQEGFTEEDQEFSDENLEESDVDTLRRDGGSASQSASSYTPSNEDESSAESKDANNRVFTYDDTDESDAVLSAEQSVGTVVIEDSDEDSSSVKYRFSNKHTFGHKIHRYGGLDHDHIADKSAVIPIENHDEILEDGETIDDVGHSNGHIDPKEYDLTAEEEEYITKPIDISEDPDVIQLKTGAIADDEIYDSTEKYTDNLSVGDAPHTLENRVQIIDVDEETQPADHDDTTVQTEESIIEEHESVERIGELENNDFFIQNADITFEDGTDENSHTNIQRNENTDIDQLLRNFKPETIEDSIETFEDSVETSRNAFVRSDLVISDGDAFDSAEKSITKVFNERAKDIIELINSSVEAQKDCPEPEKHHDHKSYRLSFLFN